MQATAITPATTVTQAAAAETGNRYVAARPISDRFSKDRLIWRFY